MSENFLNEDELPIEATVSRLRYSSGPMKERRKRILDEMIALISEKGMNAVTLQAISDRAGVAQKTLYNVFGDKETLIAHALNSHRESFLQQLSVVDERSIDNILAYLDDVCFDIESQKECSKAIDYFYFSYLVDENLYTALRSMAGAYLSGILKYYIALDEVFSWSPVETIELQFSNSAHCATHDFLMGRIPSHHYAASMKYAFVSALLSVSKGQLRIELEHRLRDLCKCFEGTYSIVESVM